MKSFIVFALFVAAAVAAPAAGPAGPDAQANIVKYDSDNIGVDGFKYAYETSNGISAQEEGQLQGVGTENEAMTVRGSYSYVGDDGVLYRVIYTAGPEGFVPEGDHIPKA